LNTSFSSRNIEIQDLVVVFEDDHLVVVDKPSGVLCVPSEQGIPSLAQTVFETVEHDLSSYDRMVVHRLGMETSGLVIFAKTMEALRTMNTLFRTRQLTRQYEALVVGHVEANEGSIDMPLMRDYVFPPYMRVSTDEHQEALVHLDSSIVGKKLLEAPKSSQTKFQVVSREYLLDTELPVSRLTLTSVSGRTHQLNVHCAAFGHPIVGDQVYGYGGEAAPNGGLSTVSQENPAASAELQEQVALASVGMKMCAHAKYLEFRHPVSGQPLVFTSKAPF
jgi:tRNA pseudouridine32 synthase/23S rRNA pseudouridine746 synthase